MKQIITGEFVGEAIRRTMGDDPLRHEMMADAWIDVLDPSVGPYFRELGEHFIALAVRSGKMPSELVAARMLSMFLAGYEGRALHTDVESAAEALYMHEGPRIRTWKDASPVNKDKYTRLAKVAFGIDD